MEIIKKESYNQNFFPEEHNSICVVRRKGEPIENIIRRFKKKYLKSNILQEYKDHMHYEKPGDKKRRKKQSNIRAIKQAKKKEIQERKEFVNSLRKKINKGS